MIDDGLHHYHAGICLFENTIARLKPNGVYLIEDVSQLDLSKYAQYFAERTGEFYARFINLHRRVCPLAAIPSS